MGPEKFFLCILRLLEGKFRKIYTEFPLATFSNKVLMNLPFKSLVKS